MPLIHGKSKQAFSHNVAAEMNAGKPQPQSLAIAYAIKRRQKKMAEGGMVENEKLHPEHEPEANPLLKELYPHKKDPKSVAHAILEKQEHLAKGGEVEMHEENDALANHSIDTFGDGEEELKLGEHAHDLFDSEPESDEFDHLEPKVKQKAMLQAIFERMHAKYRGQI